MGILSNKTAVVFGAGSSGPGWGNGKAAAVIYAGEGANVAVVDLNRNAANETKSLVEQHDVKCVAHSADVTNPDAVNAVAIDVIKQFGRIDILHNNVGIFEQGGAETTPEDRWLHVLNVNLNSMFYTCRAVLPSMVQSGKGSIVNISSLGGLKSMSNAGASMAYGVSKAGVNRLTQSIALEYASKGIRCNAIVPGFIDTPMSAGMWNRAVNDPEVQAALMESRANKLRSIIPLGRAGTAWDVAQAALFLASDESRYITGAILPVDGGLSFKLG